MHDVPPSALLRSRRATVFSSWSLVSNCVQQRQQTQNVLCEKRGGPLGWDFIRIRQGQKVHGRCRKAKSHAESLETFFNFTF